MTALVTGTISVMSDSGWTRLRNSRVGAWFTLENWTRAGDLAVKITAVVAGLAALNFFVDKPDVTRSLFCSESIDAATVRSAYERAGRKIPPAIVQEAMETHQGPPGKPCGLITFQGAAASSLSFPQAERFAILTNRYEASRDIPRSALELARLELNETNFTFALTAFDQARVYNTEFTLTNEGSAPARNLQVVAPPGYAPAPATGPQSISLDAGEALTFAYAGTDVDALEASAYSISFDDTEVVNTRLLFKIWLGAMAFWVLLILRDIAERETRQASA